MKITREEVTKLIPWHKPTTIYDDDGAACEIEIAGHHFIVADSGNIGVDTGRTRWCVKCSTCDREIHGGSTSATAQITRHLDDVGVLE